MSYPAYTSFGRQIGRDIRHGFALWLVYMALQPPVLDFREARVVKVSALARELHMGRRHVIKALRWLELHGYLISVERDQRRVRSLVLAFELDPKRAA